MEKGGSMFVVRSLNDRLAGRIDVAPVHPGV
jgi:hypothetical protein